MRVEFIVAIGGQGWSVRRGGSTSRLHYGSQDRAIAAAENFARSAATTGDTAVVKIEDQGARREHRSFAGERYQRAAADTPTNQTSPSRLTGR